MMKKASFVAQLNAKWLHQAHKPKQNIIDGLWNWTIIVSAQHPHDTYNTSLGVDVGRDETERASETRSRKKRWYDITQ